MQTLGQPLENNGRQQEEHCRRRDLEFTPQPCTPLLPTPAPRNLMVAKTPDPRGVESFWLTSARSGALIPSTSTDPVMSDSEESDLVLKHSREKVTKAKTANGLLLDAYDGADPPPLDGNDLRQFAKHCVESAAGFLRA